MISSRLRRRTPRVTRQGQCGSSLDKLGLPLAVLFLQNVVIFWGNYFKNVGFPRDFLMSYCGVVVFWTTAVQKGINPQWIPLKAMGYPLWYRSPVWLRLSFLISADPPVSRARSVVPLLGGLYAIVVITLRLRGGIPIERWTALMVVVLVASGIRLC